MDLTDAKTPLQQMNRMPLILRMGTICLMASCHQASPAPGEDASKEAAGNDSVIYHELRRLYEQPDSNYASYWCSMDILERTHHHMEKLDIVLVADFLATLHPSCISNAEFSSWSNEILFDVVMHYPDRFIELMSKNSSLWRDHILHELENPVSDEIDIDKRIAAIEMVSHREGLEWQSLIIASLNTANGKK